MNNDLIVVTDLDGTLLDHTTYQFEAARPALNYLDRFHIPLILSSSKTAAEIRDICKQLNNHHPFIIENGAGIVIPEADDSYKKITLGVERELILNILNKLRTELGFSYTGFADMRVEEVVALTGLSKEQARKARKRDFTEPLLWQGDDMQWRQFCTELERRGLSVTRGGRFIHISGSTDKGKALQWLKNYFAEQRGCPIRVLALGDSENDKAMLEHADYSVIIRSHFHALPEIKARNLLISEEYGPEGWNNCVIQLLNKLGFITRGKTNG